MENFDKKSPATIRELRAEAAAQSKSMCRKRKRAYARRGVTGADIAAFRVLDGHDPGQSAFLATNWRGRWRLAKGLMRQYRALRRADPTLEFLHVTIIDDRFAVSDEKTRIRLKDLTDMARRILTRIAPDWTAMAEIQAFGNERHQLGGKVLSPHVHAIVFGHDILRKAHSVAAECNEWMTAGDFGCDAVDVERIKDTDIDLMRVARYPLKAPYRTKTVYRDPKTGRANIHESEKGDRYVRFLRLYEILSLIEVDHMLFAGGAGVRMKNQALREVHDWLDDRSGRGKRTVQLNGVRRFWAGFMPRVGLARFEMPIIEIR